MRFWQVAVAISVLRMNKKASSPRQDWVKRTETIGGVERIEAWFKDKAYAMHRHDTYAIGQTIAGVQSFNYRGNVRNSLPGNTIVLHPDEAHDGQAGTDEGFQYRMVYIEPSLFQEVLCGGALPFIDGGLTTDPRIASATVTLLQNIERTLEPLEQSDAVAELVRALVSVSGSGKQRPKGDFLAARRAREFLYVNCDRVVALAELEAATDRDRWSLSNDFRTFYGTSPYRYLTMRRLNLLRSLLLEGNSLTDSAALAGFADQSHMARHFSKTFGLSPGSWLKLAGGAHRALINTHDRSIRR